jgi:peptidyl-prolyl cis-trans isomerase B (cyclophilin B)
LGVQISRHKAHLCAGEDKNSRGDIKLKNSILMMAVVVFLAACDGERLEQLEKRNAILSEKLNEAQQLAKKGLTNQKKLDLLAERLNQRSATIRTNYGDIEVSFMADKAPLHAMNFILRAESGFYNQTKFHRVIKGFMIQGGDPNSRDNNPADDGTGGSLVKLPAEFSTVHHAPGILSMARSPQGPHTASTQFFIMHGDNAQLDGQYSVFGKVEKGMEVVNKIANLKTSAKPKDRPLRDVVIYEVVVK